MNDNQRTAVTSSMASVAQEPLAESAERFLVRACEWAGVDPPNVSPAGRLLVTRKRVELPETANAMTVLHAVAHLKTPRIFPAHGAEFCDNLLALARRFTPWTEALLEQEFTRRRIHFNAEHRRKAVLKAVLQREVDGTQIVEAAFDDPPEIYVGGPVILDRERRLLKIGQREEPLDRLRYLAKIR